MIAKETATSRSKLNSSNARERADRLAERMRKRLADLELELKIVARPPTVLGGALVIPMGYLEQHGMELRETPPPCGRNPETEMIAINKVMETERALGVIPVDVSAENRGYDIESRDPKTGNLRFIEVKGRVRGAPTLTVPKNEILTAFNHPDAYVQAIVLVAGMEPEPAYYITQPFTQEPEFATASVNFKLDELLKIAVQQTI